MVVIWLRADEAKRWRLVKYHPSQNVVSARWVFPTPAPSTAPRPWRPWRRWHCYYKGRLRLSGINIVAQMHISRRASQGDDEINACGL